MPLDDALDALPPGVILSDVVRTTGATRLLERHVRSRRLTRIRPGAYVRAGEWEAASVERRHELLVEAAVRQLPDAVLSYESAAVAWGLPLLAAGAPRLHVSASWRGGGASSAGIVRHDAIRPIDVVDKDGRRMTTAALTVVDLARRRSFAQGLMAADAALRLELVTRDELVAEAGRHRRRRGVRRAEMVVALADARSGSPGESLSRARLRELGYATPELQVELTDERGFVGRVDFWWPTVRLAGEFDGRMKYRADGVDDARAVEDRVWDEKLREDRLRATGARVTRWTWATAIDPVRFDAHLRAARVPFARP